MSVVLDDYKIFYSAVPKIGCTSIKNAFFELENGFPFQEFVVNGRKRHIHNTGYQTLLRNRYPEQRIADYHRVAFVRGLIERFISAYSNRVLYHQELSEKKAGPALEKLGLQPTPDLGLFVDRYEEYIQAHDSIWHHTRPMVDYLGRDSDYFSRIYLLSEMDIFAEDISARVDKPFTVGCMQKGGQDHKPSDLTWRHRRKLEKLYKADIKVFGKFV